jgi:uncharacterized protein (TIGR00290 family)
VTERTVLLWSGGKDSAMTLYELRMTDAYDVSALVTTVTQEYDRISVHGVRRELLEIQARSIGLAAHIAIIPAVCDNASYEAAMVEVLGAQKTTGATVVAAGDIFLQDVRAYRARLFARAGLRAVFPIWGRSSAELAGRVISLGFKAVLTCVDTQVLDASFSGRDFDAELLADLPPNIDPCGEHGEFHTFVYDGPIFATPVSFDTGDVVIRDERFCFCDLLARRPELQSPQFLASND